MIKSKFSFLLSKDKKFIHYNAELDELHCRWTLHDSSKLIHILVNRGKSHPVGADQFCWSPQIPLHQNKDQKQLHNKMAIIKKISVEDVEKLKP